MRIWLITGSRAGVGKSTVLHRLAKVLPSSVVIKVGRSPVKLRGLQNYFTDPDDALIFISSIQAAGNVIIESNRLAGRVGADVTIFLDSSDSDSKRDTDKLRRIADIVVDGAADENDWTTTLSTKGFPPDTNRKIIKIFKDQKKFLKSDNLALRTDLWFIHDGRHVFGEGLARLLSGIETTGSLSAAARDEGLSYRHAWGDIKDAEKHLGFKLLMSSPGGARGGGSKLTRKARLLLEGYEDLRMKVITHGEKLFSKMIDKIEESK